MRINSVWIILLFIATSVLSTSCQKKRPVKPIRYTGSYTRDFNDMNDLHLKAAAATGVSSVASREEAAKLKKKLKEVKSDDNIRLMELDYSLPYLTPVAHDLLVKIGKNFGDSLRNLNAPAYKLRVTSVLRTVEDIRKLRKKNINSTKKSAHLHGATFDIAWNKYDKANENDTLTLKPEQLKMVLASVLRDLKREKACYVKHERKQGCFHITAR